MSDQENEFAAMAKELSQFKGDRCTLRMYLQYCPDAVTYLFDRCLINECNEQVLKLVQNIFVTTLTLKRINY